MNYIADNVVTEDECWENVLMYFASFALKGYFAKAFIFFISAFCLMAYEIVVAGWAKMNRKLL